MVFSFHPLQVLIIALLVANSQELADVVAGLPCRKIALRKSDDVPYCLTVSSAMDIIESGRNINFLATQVWPSARVAATTLEKHMPKEATVLEFGCGPGLPSICAAHLGAKKVYATDLDEFSLQLVEKASIEQNLQNSLETVCLDLTSDPSTCDLPKADLYLFSDVFESDAVAKGAAQFTRFILSEYPDAKIWVFAQSDRACRETYLEEMKVATENLSLKWKPLDQYDKGGASLAAALRHRLFLCDLDETKVSYE